MTEYKVGDKVRLVGSAWGSSKCGRVLTLGEVNENGWVKFVEVGDDPAYWWNINTYDREVERVFDTDTHIDAALAKVKSRFGLCSEFDDAVEHAKNLSRLEALEYVAIKAQRTDLYDALVDELVASVAIPTVGRWIRATMKDGSIREFEVTACDEGVNIVYITAEAPTFFIALRKAYHYDASRCVVSWEYIDRPWRVGDVVPAKTVVGKQWSGLYEGSDTRCARTFDVGDSEYSAVDRRIVWIEE